MSAYGLNPRSLQLFVIREIKLIVRNSVQRNKTGEMAKSLSNKGKNKKSNDRESKRDKNGTKEIE